MIEIENLENLEDDDDKINSSQVYIEKVAKDKIIKNIVKELEMKEELYKIKIITI